jgi:hypothetical protein
MVGAAGSAFITGVAATGSAIGPEAVTMSGRRRVAASVSARHLDAWVPEGLADVALALRPEAARPPLAVAVEAVALAEVAPPVVVVAAVVVAEAVAVAEAEAVAEAAEAAAEDADPNEP